MKTEYKEIYDLIRSFKFSCDYIIFKNGVYYLNLFSPNYNLFNGFKYKMFNFCLEDLKKEIINLLNKEVIKNE